MNRVPANRFACFLAISAVGLSWDLYSKSAVFDAIGYPGRSSDWAYSFCGDWVTFRLYTSFNEGALWGIGQGFTWVFAILSIAATLGILYWLFVLGAARSLWLTASLACIMSGTLGNLYDRLGLPGYLDPVTQEPIHAVRDFLLFTFGGWPWPVFNFADVCLVTGACMLVVHSVVAEQSKKTATPPRSEKNHTASGTTATESPQDVPGTSPESH